MKKFRFTAALLGIFMATQLFVPVSAGAPSFYETPSIKESLPEGNLLMLGSFDSPMVMNYWQANANRRQSLAYRTDENGGYLHVKGVTVDLGYFGYQYVPETPEPIAAGNYKFTGYFRTANKDEVMCIRVQFVTEDDASNVYFVYLTNDWLKTEIYVELTAPLKNITVRGGPSGECIAEYCMDNFSLVPVDSIPENAPTEFGTPVTFDQIYEAMQKNIPGEENTVYESSGFFINDDLSIFKLITEETTVDDIINSVKQYEGSHVTDYFINLNSGVSIYPSKVMTSHYDKYYMTEENGVPVDYTETPFTLGSHYALEVLGTDVIGIYHETLRDIGINPWISVRMNDIHDQTAEGLPGNNLSNFWHEHPQYRRVKHHPYYTYYADYALDYTYDEVREYFLTFINEALNRYDTHGIELDFQREIMLWYIGGEYKGLGLLTEFMREVKALADIYAEKYGHEIKIAVRVGATPEVCYNFGLDVVTWAAEGLVDMVSPANRLESFDNDMMIGLWDSMLEPFDVTLAPYIDPSYIRSWMGANPIGMDYELMAGAAVNMLSQGADMVGLYNYFGGTFTNEVKNTRNPSRYTIGNDICHWEILNTFGSYDKLMLQNRRHSITYRDHTTAWEGNTAALPKAIPIGETFTAFRIAVGDIPEDATATLKFAVSAIGAVSNQPIVYVNSQPCTYSHYETCSGGYTTYGMMCYEIPEEAYDSHYMVVEISSPKTTFRIDHMEIAVEVY